MYYSPSHEPSEFGTLLREDHESLFSALEDLLFDENSTPERLGRGWEAFETALHAHMRTVEGLLISRFELACPAEAARIRGEHRQMREHLEELDASFARGVVDRERLARLLGILRVSAALKENGLYDWAEEVLRPRDKARLVESIRASRPPEDTAAASA